MPEKWFIINPLNVGAEIVGLEPDAEDHPAIRAALYEAWLQHGILLFRNIESNKRHLALSRCFGELEMHPYAPVRSAEDPFLAELGGRMRSTGYVYDDSELRVNRLPWHRNSAFTPEIAKGAMLRMVETPLSEGETLFADTAKAYDDLPEPVKAKLEGLEYKATYRLNPRTLTWPRAFWKTARQATRDEDPLGGNPQEDTETLGNFPPVIHPAVADHPESGRRCLFLSPNYVDYFLGLSEAESEELLADLVSHMLQPRYVYRHRWAVNEAILWDNRRFMHAAMGWRPDQERRALRTTLAGSMHTGRLFEEETASAAL